MSTIKQAPRSGTVNTDGSPGRLYFMCGMPHAGKSTYCNRWVRDGGDRLRVVISGDDTRYALHEKEYLPAAEVAIFLVIDVAAKALLYRGFDVLIDETSTSEATLRRYLRINPNAEPIFIDTPEEVCVQRAIAAGRPYLVPHIRRLAPRMELLRNSWQELLTNLRAEEAERRLHDIAK